MGSSTNTSKEGEIFTDDFLQLEAPEEDLFLFPDFTTPSPRPELNTPPLPYPPSPPPRSSSPVIFHSPPASPDPCPDQNPLQDLLCKVDLPYNSDLTILDATVKANDSYKTASANTRVKESFLPFEKPYTIPKRENSEASQELHIKIPPEPDINFHNPITVQVTETPISPKNLPQRRETDCETQHSVLCIPERFVNLNIRGQNPPIPPYTLPSTDRSPRTLYRYRGARNFAPYRSPRTPRYRNRPITFHRVPRPFPHPCRNCTGCHCQYTPPPHPQNYLPRYPPHQAVLYPPIHSPQQFQPQRIPALLDLETIPPCPR